jgi:metal-responsive CopG/Arc/MetJ family transcriptional regulator
MRYTSDIVASRQLRKILVGIPEPWLAELDRIAVRDGKARAQVIRDAVRKLLEADRKAEERR